MNFRSLLLLLFVLNAFYAKGQISLREEVSYEFLDRLIEAASTNYPQVKMYDTRIDIGAMGLKKAKLSYFEIFSFSYIFNPSQIIGGVNPNFLTGYQFGFFFNIGGLIQKPLLIKQAKTEIEVLNLDKATYMRTLETNVKTRYYTYLQNLVLYKMKQNSLLDAQSALEDVRHKFEKGEIELSAYNNALSNLSNAQQVNINAETALLISKTSLEELVGQDIDNLK